MVLRGLLTSLPLLAILCLAETSVAQPSSGSQAIASSAAVDDTRNDGVLIVYLSRTGNTRAVAEIIHQKVGGHLVALELQTPYPDDYDAIVEQVDQENDSGYLPPLATEFDDMHRYETVFLGFPTWDMQLPPPMKSFLARHDMRGKTLIPFNTNAGFGVGSGFDDVRERSPGAAVLAGFTTEGGYEKKGVDLAIERARRRAVQVEVAEWLRKIEVP